MKTLVCCAIAAVWLVGCAQPAPQPREGMHSMMKGGMGMDMAECPNHMGHMKAAAGASAPHGQQQAQAMAMSMDECKMMQKP